MSRSNRHWPPNQASELAFATFAPSCTPVTLQGCRRLDVDPATVVALIGLGGSGVAALWKIANGLGRFEARTSTILEGIKDVLQDHEERLRRVERQP